MARAQEEMPAVLPTMSTRVVLDTGGAFQDVIARLQRESPTFRRQLRRLDARRVEIRVWLDASQRRASSLARTHLQRHEGGLATADIYLPLSPFTVELIAHEVEHLIEQLDGVDLAAHHATGDVWRNSDGSFETRRAIEAGRRVADEVRAMKAPRAVGRR